MITRKSSAVWEGSLKDGRGRMKVGMDKVGEGFKIISVNLSVEAEVPGIGDQEFQALAEKAKATCPVSQALAGTKITLRAKKVG